jgi:DNA invertase Pin-like site-specific DNA recombinase
VAPDSLQDVDTLIIWTLDRIGRSTQNMLAFAEEFRGRGAGLRVPNLGGVDSATPMGSMLFTTMAALGQVEHEIKRERVVDSITKRRETGKNLGGRLRIIQIAPTVTDSGLHASAQPTVPALLEDADHLAVDELLDAEASEFTPEAAPLDSPEG